MRVAQGSGRLFLFQGISAAEVWHFALRKTADIDFVEPGHTLGTDPKILHDLLREASGLTGRRAKEFRPAASAHRLAELLEDFEPLRQLQAFREMEEEIRKVLANLGCLIPAQGGHNTKSASNFDSTINY